MAAKVVDLPEPVGPVTSTKPFSALAIFLKISGASSSSSVGMLLGMVRNTAAQPRDWLKALTRKRPTLCNSNEKSTSSFSSNSLRCASFMISKTKRCTSWCVNAGMPSFLTSPSIRTIGGTPAERCRSEALCFTLKSSNSVISI